ncbi:hypothetical protein [Actinopolymorpha sp. B9G3]|uniref:hypothetical protein n=1 Tax=Actinopolymorpha sp. B9G3 TaxID=3158970 RepID=UPI0032D9807E
MTSRIEAGPVPVAARRGGRRALVGWLFIGPVIFGVIAFQFVPVMVSLYASPTDWTGLSSIAFGLVLALLCNFVPRST